MSGKSVVMEYARSLMLGKVELAAYVRARAHAMAAIVRAAR